MYSFDCSLMLKGMLSVNFLIWNARKTNINRDTSGLHSVKTAVILIKRNLDATIDYLLKYLY